MTLTRERAKEIADQLNLLASMVKTRSRASLTDANRILETIAKRFFNALFGWELKNLNVVQANYPAADLGDPKRRIAIQITNEDSFDKITRTATKAVEHNLGSDFDRLIVFFLLQSKPGLPKRFVQPSKGPVVVTWDIGDLLKQMLDMDDPDALARAADVLKKEMSDGSLAELMEQVSKEAEDIKNHVTSELARQQMLADAREATERADSLFDEKRYRDAAGLFRRAASYAKQGGAADLEGIALLSAVQAEINQHTIIDRSTVVPFGEWHTILSRVASLGVLPASRLIMEARVAFLRNDLTTAESKLTDAASSPDISKNRVECARMLLELIGRRARAGEAVSTERVEATERTILAHLMEESPASSLVALFSLIGVRAELAWDVGQNMEKLEEYVDGLLARSPRNSPHGGRDGLIVEAAGRTVYQLRSPSEGVRLARLALRIAHHFGDCVDEARIGELLARQLSTSAVASSSQDLLKEAIELRRQLAVTLSGSNGAPDSAGDEAATLFAHHTCLRVLDTYRLFGMEGEDVSAQRWNDLLTDGQVALEFLRTNSTRVRGDVNGSLGQMLEIIAEVHVKLGRYRDAAHAFQDCFELGRKSGIANESLFSLAHDSVYFFCASGQLDKAGVMRNVAGTLVPDAKANARLAQLDRFTETVKATHNWLGSDDAMNLQRLGEDRGIRAAIRPTVAHLFGLWDDLRKQEIECAGAIYDYWGRGSFLRICVAIRAQPDDCITVDASTLDEVILAAQVLCPCFETVMVKWKGPLCDAGKGLTGGVVRKDREQKWLYGSGLVHCAVDEEHYGFLGHTNEPPAEVVAFLRTDARCLVESGRLFVVPAQLVGCAQRFVGASDAAFADQLLDGAFLGSGGDGATVPQESRASLVDLVRVTFPFYEGISLVDLARVLDDIGPAVRPFQREICRMLSGGELGSV